MTPLFKKLNFKDQAHIVSLNHPESFYSELEEMADQAQIMLNLDKLSKIEFVIAFAQT